MNEVAPTSAPAHGLGTTDPDEFQLPLAGLYADLELGTGSVRLPDDFAQRPALVQLKVIGHWQHSLTRYRQQALRRFAHELSRGAPELDEAGRMDLLRTTCASLRIDLPGDFTRQPSRP